MKFLLVFSICSALTGFCYEPQKMTTEYNTWADCVGAGGFITSDFAEKMHDKINENKLYISYTCYEVKKGDPT